MLYIEILVEKVYKINFNLVIDRLYIPNKPETIVVSGLFYLSLLYSEFFILSDLIIEEIFHKTVM
ncbi:hypothetical protein E1N04_02915 [Staphylococcus epidermidis]|nr:hypothetical protein E1N07_00340 [Staphylococcus epidermidis]TES27596.1 hypothetical protein E1N04_02915 [Staphylococcus epidermidis]